MRHRYGGGYDEPPKTPGWVYFAIGLGIAAMVGLYLGWAEWIHGDWRCALAQCRIETK